MPKEKYANPFAHNLGTTSVVVLPAAVVVTIAPAVAHFVLVTVSTVRPDGVVVIVGSYSLSSAPKAVVIAASDKANSRTPSSPRVVELAVGLLPIVDKALKVDFPLQNRH